MLVLSRRLGESIVINDDIAIHVIELGRGKVKIGFEAPKDVIIHRMEIYEDSREKRGLPPHTFTKTVPEKRGQRCHNGRETRTGFTG